MVPLLFALSLFLTPAKFASTDVVQHAVQDFGPQTVATHQASVQDPGAVAERSTNELSDEELALFNLINEDRTSQGLRPVTLDPDLVAIARAHSRDMSDRKYFDHYAPSPGPVTPMDRYLAFLGRRPEYAMVGENIYYRSVTDLMDQTANQADAAFMNSPGHRANILQPRFTKAGVGFFRAPNGQFWVTEMFLRDRP
ncbi:MAG: CAP domain-containing protein [Capsulimonadaceae bacterium]|nr:CAP domain-containing protein [Capsulimonadaceae bacterium]